MTLYCLLNITKCPLYCLPVFHVAKGSMAMGCQPNLLTLSVEPNQITRRSGEVIEVSVSAVRRTAMGNVTISAAIPQYPKSLHFKPITLASDETRATLRLRLDESVQLPPRVTLEILAESSHDGLPISAAATLKLVAP